MTSLPNENHRPDVVLVSNATTAALRAMSQQAIDSAGTQARVIMLESNRSVSYHGATTLYPDVPFGYNAYLNIGARAGTGEYIFFGNNDLLFTPGWDAALIGAMRERGAASASPLCPRSHAPFGLLAHTGVRTGYQVFERFCGWAFMWTRALFERAGGLDETFTFWCSDNATVAQLQQLNQAHLLVTGSVVHHLGGGSNTIDGLDAGTTYQYTVEEIRKYNQVYDQDLRIDRSWRLPANLALDLPDNP